MAQSLPPYPPVECQSEGKGIRWTKWITRLTNNVFVGYNITDDARKRALMLTYAGEDLNDIFATLSTKLVTPQPGTDETVFSKAVEALDVYFNPKQNKEFQRYVFRHTNQERFESVEKFSMRLMQLAVTCNFTETISEIKSQLIAGSINDKITRKGLSEPDISLNKLLQFAKTLELTDIKTRPFAERRRRQPPIKSMTAASGVNNRPIDQSRNAYRTTKERVSTAAASGPTREDRRSALLVNPDARFVTRLIISPRATRTMIGLVGIQYTHPLIDRLNAAINTSITCRPTKTSSTYTH